MREISKCFTKFQTRFSACTQHYYIHLQEEVKHSEYKWHVQGHTQSQLQSQQKRNEIFAKTPWLWLPDNGSPSHVINQLWKGMQD